MKALSHSPIVGLTVNENVDICVLGNGRIETERLETEEDLIGLFNKLLPAVVSLSITVGAEAGVESNVATDTRARTNTLAKTIRDQGFPVVGSDLRVANTILGRRRETMLSQLGGLSSISPARSPQSDATTAALVGWLFWSGFFDVIEATEDLSIVVPSNAKRDKWSDRAAIGLSGFMGAGKTTAGMHLQKRGFYYARYSLVVKRMAQELGREPSRTTLQELGREVHETRGQYWLGRELLKTLPNSGCIVIDGLRYPEDHAFLAGSFGPCFGHITIATPPATRRRQFVKSNPTEDYETAERHRSEAGVEMLTRLAHMTISNDGSLDRFLATIDTAVDELLDKTGRVWRCRDR